MDSKKKVIVLSLGGSLIVPGEIDTVFLSKFKKVIKKSTKKYKFVIVCGGGSIARKYISALRIARKSDYLQSMIGISITRVNARFVSYFFDKDPERGIPHKLKQVKKLLRKKDIVFCGGLKYEPYQTSDGTAAEIAAFFNCDFINLTNVPGLHDKNPLKYKDAKFIPKISFQNLYDMVNKVKYRPGQHFVLDQTAVKIIKEKKIRTYILGKNMKNLDNLLNNRKFHGTIVG